MNELTSMLGTDGIVLSPALIAINLSISLVLSLFISYIYQKTHRGLSYSQTLAVTLVFLTIVVTIAMMVIGNNLARAFGLLGAFSIVRFRTAIKDTKDIAYIFFALVIGMAVGTNSYAVAVISTLFVCLLLLILTKTNFGSMRRFDHVVTFTLDTEKASNDAYQSIFKKYLKQSLLLNVNAVKGGKKLEFTFNARFTDESKSGNFSEELGSILGIDDVTVLTSKEDVEY
jgi:uncharacterized membrane protein YhiD involved in acid resistance